MELSILLEGACRSGNGSHYTARSPKRSPRGFFWAATHIGQPPTRAAGVGRLQGLESFEILAPHAPCSVAPGPCRARRMSRCSERSASSVWSSTPSLAAAQRRAGRSRSSDACAHQQKRESSCRRLPFRRHGPLRGDRPITAAAGGCSAAIFTLSKSKSARSRTTCRLPTIGALPARRRAPVGGTRASRGLALGLCRPPDSHLDPQEF